MEGIFQMPEPRTIMITGGSRGLGLAAAKRFAGEGANIVILSRDQGHLDGARGEIEAAGATRVVALRCDVAESSQIDKAYDAAMEACGKIDVLVNNAGASNALPFEQITDENWRTDLDVKLFATIRLARLVLPQMKARQGGRIINILSTGAKIQEPDTAPSSVTRAAGLALTKILSLDGAPHNVLVTAVLVGAIVSDQIARSHKKSNSPLSLDEYVADYGRRVVPLGRFGRPEEFADLVAFLASDSASYITGAGVNLDGGYCLIP